MPKKTISWEFVFRFMFHGRALLILFLGMSLFSCAPEHEDPASEPFQSALFSASADLLNLGFDEQSLNLLHQGAGTPIEFDRAREQALLYERVRDGGSAASCMERLYPRGGSPEVMTFKVDAYLKSWQWVKASKLLQGQGEDPRLLEVRDILSRTRQVREFFGRTHALNWRTIGWHLLRSRENLLLSAGRDASPGDERLEFYTPLGWNGQGFRQSMEVQVVRFEKGARVIWGFSAGPPFGSDFQEGSGPYFLVDYHEGRIALRSDGSEEGTAVQDERRWHWPMGVWLRIVLEYVPDISFYDASKVPGTGRVKAWLEEPSKGIRLLTLEGTPPAHLNEGRMLAGLYGLRGETTRGERLALRVDNFNYDN